MRALPDAVGDLGARRLGRWMGVTLVALLLLAAAAGAVLYRHRGAPPGAPGDGGHGAPAPAEAVR